MVSGFVTSDLVALWVKIEGSNQEDVIVLCFAYNLSDSNVLLHQQKIQGTSWVLCGGKTKLLIMYDGNLHWGTYREWV